MGLPENRSNRLHRPPNYYVSALDALPRGRHVQLDTIKTSVIVAMPSISVCSNALKRPHVCLLLLHIHSL